MNIGDRGRLEYIKSVIEKQNTLFTSDKNYVEKLSKELLPIKIPQTVVQFN